eukprot:CAMPEP_0167761502 /NCGR_PEP_ID=MMETSP0110_2-20121227/12212_1 /TAXON_ID=629695 /ORGANISM="Gymnochlora sp., Strain CCMP2014" /LENGTH=264 /DNA_ID=CAMNT_0007648201 /DNA_START=59 /DNA_END=853 /DNA_ORIENTATION=+
MRVQSRNARFPLIRRRDAVLGLTLLPLAPAFADELDSAAVQQPEVVGERKMSAVERLKERQRKALAEAETKAEKIQYDDGSSLLIYSRESLEDLRQKDPVVRQRLNAPGRGSIPKQGFPYFVRDGFSMKMFIEDDFSRDADGLTFKVLAAGKVGGVKPKDGQKVIFDFTAYNEGGEQIDSSLRKAEPPAAKIGLGTIVPGVELALKDMTVGERRRVVVPPNLGPPTGPSTFFSAKQFQTFDIELKDIKTCVEKQTLFVTNEECT